MQTLLTLPNDNPKTRKAEHLGWYTPILHLAPHTTSGYQVCPMARGCEKTCLFYSGHGGRKKSQLSRIKRTKYFFEHRAQFMKQLIGEILFAELKAEELGLKLAVRLNGTSDICWEKIRAHNARSLIEFFDHVQFYDYTKIRGRTVPSNYHLTFSQDDHNEQDCLELLTEGINVATIFKSEMPPQHLGHPVINGEADDLRFLDPHPVIVGLKFKHNTFDGYMPAL